MSFNQNYTIKKMIDEQLIITTQDFLFHTLNSIARTAFFEDSPKTEELIFCLSDLLRYHVEHTEDFPEIKSEIEHIKQYLHLQQIRFGDRLHVHIDIPDTLEGYHIPSFLLQPIMEHVFMEKIEGRAEGGSIYLTARIENNAITIDIKDNRGVSNGKKIIHLEQEMSFSSQGPADIETADQRIKQYFGTEYGVAISRNEQDGTWVKMEFPCFKELSLDHSLREDGRICLH